MKNLDIGDLARINCESLRTLHGKIVTVVWTPRPYTLNNRTLRIQLETGSLMFIEEQYLEPAADMEEPNFAFRLRRHQQNDAHNT